MSTQPQLSPLEQLGQDVQQAPAQQQSTPSGPQLSPLELLGQDVLQAPPQTSTSDGATPFVPNARIRNMNVDPTKGLHSATEAFLSGAKTGTEAAAIPASMIGLGEAAPIIGHLAEVVPNLDKAYKVLKTIGAATSGAGGTLYTLQHLKDVLKIIGGGSK